MNKYVVGIGAANVDIYGKSDIKIREHFDHPSIIKTAVGGVTRNVLENISKLGIETKLLTAVGDDIYGQLVLDKSKKAGIDVSHVLKVKNGRTGIFMQVQDSNNDMHLALCDMSISKNIDIKYVKANASVIKNAEVIVLDPSLDKEVITYILDNFKVPVFVDPISDLYAKKIRPYLSKIYCIKPNLSELSVLANMTIDNDDDLFDAYKKVNKKVKQLYVSLGRKGSLYKDDFGFMTKKNFRPVEKMVNASGAGDSCMACLVYGHINNMNMDKTVDYCLAAGLITIQSEETINPKFGVKLIRKVIKENYDEL